MSTVSFVRALFRHGKNMGALVPSSPQLAERMAELAEVGRAERVVELGPGTGALTAAVVDALPKEASLLGIDLNEDFVGHLRRRYPAHRFERACAKEFDFDDVWPDGEGFDVVISGLPWTIFPISLQESILDNVLPRLRPGGRFATFAYWGFHQMEKGRQFRERLHERLPGVETSRVIWANLPPAFVYVGRKPGLSTCGLAAVGGEESCNGA